VHDCVARIARREQHRQLRAQLPRLLGKLACLSVGASLAQQLAKQGYRRACFVGSGALAGTTRESALKILELTAGNIQTMNETTLGLRHGPMSSLNTETLFVSFVSRDGRRRRYDLDLLNEIRAKSVVRTIVLSSNML